MNGDFVFVVNAKLILIVVENVIIKLIAAGQKHFFGLKSFKPLNFVSLDFLDYLFDPCSFRDPRLIKYASLIKILVVIQILDLMLRI